MSYIIQTHPKAVEAEEGINMSLYYNKPHPKLLRQKKELICHYIYSKPIQLLRQKKELICHYIYQTPSKAVEAEEGIKYVTIFIQTPSKAVEAEEGI